MGDGDRHEVGSGWWEMDFCRPALDGCFAVLLCARRRPRLEQVVISVGGHFHFCHGYLVFRALPAVTHLAKVQRLASWDIVAFLDAPSQMVMAMGRVRISLLCLRFTLSKNGEEE